MTAFSAGRKISSFVMLAVGIVCVIFSLALDCMGLKFFIDLGNGNLDIRGGILVIGILPSCMDFSCFRFWLPFW